MTPTLRATVTALENIGRRDGAKLWKAWVSANGGRVELRLTRTGLERWATVETDVASSLHKYLNETTATEAHVVAPRASGEPRPQPLLSYMRRAR